MRVGHPSTSQPWANWRKSRVLASPEVRVRVSAAAFSSINLAARRPSAQGGTTLVDPNRSFVEQQLEQAMAKRREIDAVIAAYEEVLANWTAHSKISQRSRRSRSTGRGIHDDKRRIEEYLATHPGRVFGPTEIAKELHDPATDPRKLESFRSAVSRILQKLLEEGRLVENPDRGIWRVVSSVNVREVPAAGDVDLDSPDSSA